MSRREIHGPREAPPQIDWGKPVKLIDQPGLPEQYHLFDKESALAVRAALGACRPLLVRGEPGVGKTQLAAASAKVLERPLVPRVVDSRTDSRDLLWEFDAVERLAEAQIAGALAPRVHSTAGETASEGETRDPHEAATDFLRTRLAVGNFVRPGALWWGFDWEGATRQAKKTGSPVPKLDGGADPRNGCVVLIDEIDKADTDVPNGLLEALGSGEFTIPQGREDPVRVKVEGKFPLVIITTNEERVLPGAFVRRCLVLHLRLPREDGALRKFLVDRARVHFPEPAQSEGSDELFAKAADLVIAERREAEKAHVSPLPGQAEYLDLIRAVLTLEPTPVGRLEILKDISTFTLQKHEGSRT
jgi:MoxR-like ATPase